MITIIRQIADKNGYGVCKEFSGHGVGRKFHNDPPVLHFSILYSLLFLSNAENSLPILLVTGMTFTIGKKKFEILF